jgi:hypothetical protein
VDGRVVCTDVVCGDEICWFFMHILLGILIFKWLTARRLYKSFGIKGLKALSQHRILVLRTIHRINSAYFFKQH